MPHKVPQNPAALRAAVFSLSAKNLRGGGLHQPPLSGRGLRNGELKFWTPVNFEVECFLNEETEGVLTDTVIYFSDQHLTWLSQLKPKVC